MVNAPASLFKFMPPYGEAFLDNFLLRATPRIHLNDPYEFYPRHSDLVETRSFYENAGIKLNSIELSAGTFPAHGVISFSETCSSKLLWSYYADGHRGIALQFDPAHRFFADLRRVRYDSTKPNEVTELSELFLVKDEQWMHEREYRLIKYLPEHDARLDRTCNPAKPLPRLNEFPIGRNDHYYMFEVPRDALVSITFGCRADRALKDRVAIKLSSEPSLQHVKLFDTELAPDHFRLCFVPSSLGS